MSKREIEERLREVLSASSADASRGVVVNGRDGAVTIVGSVINIHGVPPEARSSALDAPRTSERRRTAYREIRVRLSGQPLIRRSFATWLSSMHGAKDMTELDDETLDFALTWVRQRTAE